ncbi:hypothetical protein HN011_007707 [Eciton burchellii]|nr:hypothetical protein HN011_007707 [Eciton burchellii]
MQNKLIKEESRSARLQSAVHILKEEIRSTPTYTSVTKSSKQVQRTICNASKKHVLFVQNNNKDKTSKEIKDELTNKINPKTDKIKIKAIRQTRANSIIMEFDTRSDLQKFKDHPKFTTLKIEEPRKRKPLMIIYDVDSSLTASELKESIKHQNLDELSIEREDIIIPRFKTGPRDKPKVHWVIQTDPRVRKYIVQQGNRLYMGFTSLKVRDFMQVARNATIWDTWPSTAPARNAVEGAEQPTTKRLTANPKIKSAYQQQKKTKMQYQM